MDHELEHLLERCVALREHRQRGALVGLGDLTQREVHVLWSRGRARLSGELEQPLVEAALQRGAQGEQRGLPLPFGQDPGEAPVVQLVAEVEHELDVVVGEHVWRVRDREGRQRVHVARELGQ
jgi:hypothetical protein